MVAAGSHKVQARHVKGHPSVQHQSIHLLQTCCVVLTVQLDSTHSSACVLLTLAAAACPPTEDNNTGAPQHIVTVRKCVAHVPAEACCSNQAWWITIVVHTGQACRSCTYSVSRSGLGHNASSSVVAVEGWPEPHCSCVGPRDTAGPRCVGAEPCCDPPGSNHPCCASTAACRRYE